MVTSAWGHRRLSSRITGGSRPLTRDWQVPMRSLPPRPLWLLGHLLGPAHSLQHLQRPGQEPLPRLGELDPLADALEQGDTQLLLQLLKLHGDSGLGIA